MIKLTNRHKSVEFEPFSKDNDKYLSITVPLLIPEDGFLVVTKNITQTDKMLDKIMQNIIIINLSAIFLILFYALFLSRMLLVPIKTLTYKLSLMNEGFLNRVDTKVLPTEFLPLGRGINKLIHRIHNFVKYQKELFIGRFYF